MTTATQSQPDSAIKLVRTIADLRAAVHEWRRRGDRIALVPTMGALHEGHLRLVREAQRVADRVVVSIFVNPTQFAPHEDFQSYPRTWDEDRRKLAELAADAIFAPDAAEMYPLGFATEIRPGGPAEGLESDLRPHFFTGVATVVAKLLLAALPDVALFGEKDYQQLLVVKRLAKDLDIPCRIEGVETVREDDGLALSSRNSYLSRKERAAAPALFSALRNAAAALANGTPQDEALAEARAELGAAGFDVDYVALRNAETLEPVSDTFCGPRRLLAAARLGSTRLIDNIAV